MIIPPMKAQPLLTSWTPAPWGKVTAGPRNVRSLTGNPPYTGTTGDRQSDVICLRHGALPKPRMFQQSWSHSQNERVKPWLNAL